MNPINDLTCQEDFSMDEVDLPTHPANGAKRKAHVAFKKTFASPLRPSKAPRQALCQPPSVSTVNSESQPCPCSPKLQEQISLIEKYLSENPVVSQTFSLVTAKIHEICNSSIWDENTKLAELGTLYFYLTRDQGLTNCTSFVGMRESEIEKEIESLIAISKISTSPRMQLLPTGVTAYHQRAFARMIITPNGTFNLGGCYAVIGLLDKRLCLWVTEEQRMQILTILNLLIQDGEFRTLLTTPFSIHPTAVERVHIDLKLGVDEPIDFIYVQWALLIAFFSTLGQTGFEGNCFAVAPLLNFLKTHPEILMDLVIQALRKGSFTFEGIEIPIPPLLKGKPLNEPYFNILLPKDFACSLIGIAIAEEALGVKHAVEIPCENITLNDLIQLKFGDKAALAKEYFYSLNQSYLQQICLAIIQFTALNTSTTDPNYSQRYVLCYQFISAAIPEFKKSCDAQGIALRSEENSELPLDRLQKRASKQLWIVDANNQHFKIEKGRIRFDFHTHGLMFKGKTARYAPFLNTRQFVRFYDGVWEPIEKISEFGKFLGILAKEEFQGSAEEKKMGTILQEVYESESFHKSIAILIEGMNPLSTLVSEEYLESDSFFLTQRGGCYTFLSDWNPGKRIQMRKESVVFQEESVLSFCLQLCAKIADFEKLKPELFAAQDLPILAIHNSHAFNIVPKKFQVFWKDDPMQALKKWVLEPARNLYKSKPSLELQTWISTSE